MPEGATPPAGNRESGFTLIEMVIAMLLMAIVFAAIAPAFYGLMKATSTTNHRSVANGIAVQASEQMRSIPYYEVGFYTTPAGCPGTTATTAPVILASSVPAPLASLPTSQTVDNVAYGIQRCVNWVPASTSDPEAYKQSVITITWTVNGVSGSLSQKSALYPGGETYTYAQTGGAFDFAPGGTPTTVAGSPQPPTLASVAPSTGTDPTQDLLITWTAPTSGPTTNITYEVFWATNTPTSTNPYPEFSTSTGYNEQNVSNGTSTVITVGSSTTAWVQVYTVYGSSVSTQSNTLSGTTQSAGTGSTTPTTAPAGCIVSGITVTPDGTSTSPEVLDGNGNPLYNPTVFTVSVSVAGNCTGVQVGYNPSACVLATSTSSSGTTTTSTTTSGGKTTTTTVPSTCSPTAYLNPVAGSGGSGTLTATTPTAQKWVAGTQDFLVYVNGAIYSPATEAQSYMCTENGKSGKC